MSPVNRRAFVAGLIVTGTAAATPFASKETIPNFAGGSSPSQGVDDGAKVDFRYAPHHSQSTICFPDDPHKSVIGQSGDLRYGFAKSLLVGMEDFATVVEFSLAGFQDDQVTRQWIEAPGVPIVHTLIERPAATLELTAFATRHGNEGRVDNVLLSIKSNSKFNFNNASLAVAPKLHIRTCERLELQDYNSSIATAIFSESKAPFLVGAKLGEALGRCVWWEEAGFTLYLPHGEAAPDHEARYFVRIPQEKQSAVTLREHLQEPETLLAETREFWSKWKPFGTTEWSYPERHGEFLTACARNIQQAREVKNGRLVFQVGPTVYRGLWIVDGNFLLEAARYLGYDKEADEGLRSEWSNQSDTGQVIAGSGGEHWKDTAIAMFTLVRQCELKQDWSLFHELEPNVNRAIDFLIGLRDQARNGKSTNGRYGLLTPGFADGGIDGVRSEFTNTVWTLAGLRAVAAAAKAEGIPTLDQKAAQFSKELYAALQETAKKETVRHPAGFNGLPFTYLPMIAHDDPLVSDPDPWNRPRPQTAQWALSHAIYPGLVFEKDDPIVRGHIALLQSCTQEDVPAETGWLWHDSLWTYNASFAAHVYLWAGLRDWAHRTFTGFLNHASPLYCWREEQPLQHALVGQDWGDMPHNWASAECVRYLRHMLALEDGQMLRLLEGITSAEVVSSGSGSSPSAYVLHDSPTRFGRISLAFEPAGTHGWRLQFERAHGPRPAIIAIPETLAELRFDNIAGAPFQRGTGRIEVDPTSSKWEAFWK